MDSTYEVHSTREKVYIETSQGCFARLCKVSAEFDYFETWIPDCTFEQFQEEAKRRHFVVEDKHRPEWAK
jgi:hypothetical protein